MAHRWDYGSRRRGPSFEESAFLDTLRQMDLHVTALDLAAARKLSRREFARLVLQVAYESGARTVFAVAFRDELSPSTLDDLRRNGHYVINWFTDDHWRYDEFSRPLSQHIDLAATTSLEAYRRYLHDGLCEVVKTQWAANTRLYRPLNVQKRWDIGFAGQAYGDRPRAVARLRRLGLNIQTAGLGWPAGRLTLAELVRFINECRIFLNFGGSLSGGGTQVKARDFEVPACGTALLTNSGAELAAYLEPGTEAATFSGVDALGEEAIRLLQDRAGLAEIARLGMTRVRDEHTYVRRLTEVLDRAARTQS